MNLNFLKRKRVFKKGGLHTKPEVYWGIIQLSAIALILASFSFSFFLFRQINQDLNLTIADTKNEVTTLNKDKIDKTLQYFSDRSQKADEILHSPSPIVDPSR